MLLIAALLPLFPCTTFFLNKGKMRVFGFNYDWDIEFGMMTVNQRGMIKKAWMTDTEETWYWESIHGSVTLNQYGREFPLAGMNEAGLVIAIMWLDSTRYPSADARLALPELQWIQYQLDTAATVAEVIRSDRTVRIRPDSNPLHFLVADRKGRAAAIEFLEGRMIVHTGGDLPVAALTNATYDYCVEKLRLYERGETRAVMAEDSPRRFVLASLGLKDWQTIPKGSAVDHAFRVLETVHASRTMFRVVFDSEKGAIHFCTKSLPRVRTIVFARFDFSCRRPVKILDVMAGGRGDVSADFRDYTYQANYELIKKSFWGTDFLRDTPDRVLRSRARFPEECICD